MNTQEEKNNKQEAKQDNIPQSLIILKDFFSVKPGIIIFYVGWFLFCLILLITDSFDRWDQTNHFILLLILPGLIIYIVKVISILKHFSKTKKFDRKKIKNIAYGVLILALVSGCSYGGYYLYDYYKTYITVKPYINKNTKILYYTLIRDNYDLPTYENFCNDLTNPEKRIKMYAYLKYDNYDFSTLPFDKYEKYLKGGEDDFVLKKK